MILVDSSIWVDHLRHNDDMLVDLLQTGRVLMHPFVIGELALGNLRQRKLILGDLSDLPQATVATDTEVIQFIENHALFGLGVGYIDVHLLASTKLTNSTTLWSRDRRLDELARRLGMAATLT